MPRLFLPSILALAVVAASAACTASHAHAQTASADPAGAAPAPAAAPHASPRRPVGRWVAAVGTDALGRDAGSAAPGVAALAGYELRVGGPGSRLAFRLAGDYWRTTSRYAGDALGDGTYPLDVRRTTTLVGAGLSAIVRLPDAGRLRPYALAGVGAQQYSHRNEAPSSSGGTVVYLPPVRVNVATFSAGVGASARVGRATPFAEARLTALPALTAAGAGRVRAPITLGVRF